jgi:pyruvate dehydrogenase complex dehydrogenase (E1) component
VLGTINMASREGLDNLVLVVNCNLQRLDGPVAATARSSRSWSAPSAAPTGTSSR